MNLKQLFNTVLIATVALLALDPRPVAAQKCQASDHLQDAATGQSRRALVFADQKELKDRFDFSKVIKAILTSAGKDPSKQVEFVQSMLDSMGKTSFDNAGLAMPVDRRAEATTLKAESLLGVGGAPEMFPLAVFNRIDLAPRHWQNCGEFRIVYGRKKSLGGRFLLIFEARLPADPASGPLGMEQRQARCREVANLWSEIAKPGVTAAAAAEKLEQFYFAGLLSPSPAFSQGRW